jgi:predicted cupin superfamily sugar epimerase
MTPEQIIEMLGLEPHPEGGYFRETWRDAPADGSRGAGTAIYFLLKEGQSSAWHRIDSAEVWHWYSGAPLELSLRADGQTTRKLILGPELDRGQRPQRTVEPGVWQSARPLGAYTLAGCTVSPAFEFEHFELATTRDTPGT